MNPVLRTTLFAAFALASIDGQAKADKPCVATLEARPTHEATAVATKPKSGCPIAVARRSLDGAARSRWFASRAANPSRQA